VLEALAIAKAQNKPTLRNVSRLTNPEIEPHAQRPGLADIGPFPEPGGERQNKKTPGFLILGFRMRTFDEGKEVR